MKHAWVEETVIRDLTSSNPFEIFNPEVAKFYDTEVPDGAEAGDMWVNGEIVKPTPPEPPPEPESPPPKVTPVEFKLLFTSAERVIIKTERAVDPVIDDFYDIVEDPRLTHVDLDLQSTKDALNYMASKNLLTPERVLEILQGVVK